MLKKLKLNLKGIPESQREIAKEDVTDFILNEINRSLASGKSPVAGESFPKLNKEYAKEEKGGNRTPNLQLEGDLLSNLEGFSTIGTNEINIGYQDGNPESEKADGHNKFTGRKNNLPKRRFIPSSKQKFDEKIVKGYNRILDSYRVREETELEEASSESETPERTEITLTDLFGSTLDRILNGSEN